MYFLTIIDNYTRNMWVYLFKDKPNNFHNYNNWKRQVNNQTKKMIKFLRADNRLEFFKTEFGNICKENGTIRHKFVPFNSPAKWDNWKDELNYAW